MRLAVTIVLIVIVLLAIPVVYLWLFPPFRQPETGHLESSLTRDFDLRVGGATVIRLAVDHDPRIFEGSTPDFPPTAVEAAVTVLEGSPGPLDVRVLPADPGTIIEGLESETGGLRWKLPCEGRGPGRPDDRACRRGYVAVITAPDLADEARVRLSLAAELAFPPHVPTPFLVGIGLDASEIDGGDAAQALRTATDDGTFTISAERPVAWQTVTVSSEDQAPLAADDAGGMSGMLVRVDATRRGAAVPTGLDAPPPVRFAVLDASGRVLADLALRPTRPATIALPALECVTSSCDEDYHLVAQWRDRAAQSYEIGWSIEAAVVTGSSEFGLGVASERAEYPGPLAAGGGQGTADLRTSDNRRQFEIELEVDPGVGVGQDHLPPAAGVLHLDLELRTGEDTTVLYLDDGDGRGGGLPVVLEPGQEQAAVVDALAGCERTCFRWTAMPLFESAPDGSPVDVSVSIDWRADVTVWPLDPFADPVPSVSGR